MTRDCHARIMFLFLSRRPARTVFSSIDAIDHLI